VIKQSKAFVRKVSYSYGIRLIDEVSQASRQKREQRTHAATKNSASLSSLAAYPTAHPATADQSDAVLHNLPIKTGCDCCHGFFAEGCRVAPPYEFPTIILILKANRQKLLHASSLTPKKVHPEVNRFVLIFGSKMV